MSKLESMWSDMPVCPCPAEFLQAGKYFLRDLTIYNQ